MIITRLEPVTKYKTKVYLDDQFAFCLSNRDIFMHGIKEEGFLSEADYKELDADASKKAIVKAMNVLKQMDRTEHELRTKLKQDGFADKHIEDAISYVESFHYIDDVRYTVGYIQARKSSKSKMQIKMGLMKKGIDDDIIRQAYDEISEYYQEDQEDAEIEAI
ncbi:MAG: regulatory protein RecX, partial [Lachnospiraceae bacterium]|nr:regulatory protein RecX [Lachnospiraceae bacterium]